MRTGTNLREGAWSGSGYMLLTMEVGWWAFVRAAIYLLGLQKVGRIADNYG